MAKSAGTKKAKSETAGAAEVAEAPAYVVFARRFRPQSFGDVVGQETVTAALRHALRAGRLAQAYLLAGPRGVGKTSLARIFAKALNCLKGTGPGGVAEEPCNACEACASIQSGAALDVI
jgi:DNA polymerase III subunit gamma/tau